MMRTVVVVAVVVRVVVIVDDSAHIYFLRAFTSAG
jgi:hypothetical protein